MIMYANKETRSMKSAIDETNRRRALQKLFNLDHGITPASIRKEVTSAIEAQKIDDTSSQDVTNLHVMTADQIRKE